MSTPAPTIDRAWLRVALRKLEDEYVFAMLYEAIERLPDPELAALAARFLPKESFSPSGDSPKGLVAEVQTFDLGARRGDYFVSFIRNSKNYTNLSKGTTAFAAECSRLLGRCVAKARQGDLAAVRNALDILLTLLRAVDKTDDDIIFFADEGGVWTLGIDWPPVLRAWFLCLARSASPEEYARLAVTAIDDFEAWRRDTHVAAAMELADERQRHAVCALVAQKG